MFVERLELQGNIMCPKHC
uniref:Uncharacterized protein n=1 Tax=Arundo donax TaxID=35708 RepID=A0A0A8YLQ3_ARUDO